MWFLQTIILRNVSFSNFTNFKLYDAPSQTNVIWFLFIGRLNSYKISVIVSDRTYEFSDLIWIVPKEKEL